MPKSRTERIVVQVPRRVRTRVFARSRRHAGSMSGKVAAAWEPARERPGHFGETMVGAGA